MIRRSAPLLSLVLYAILALRVSSTLSPGAVASVISSIGRAGVGGSSGLSPSSSLGEGTVTAPPSPKATTVPGTSPAADLLASVSVSGIRATWYCGARCTRGYPPSCLCAAISPDLAYLRGKLVTVCATRCVRVLVVDCDCQATRSIDLYAAAFSQLAPLSRGAVTVSVR